MLLALALFGLRYLLTLPCFLVLAVQALRSSVELAGYSLGYGGRRGTELYGVQYFVKFFAVAAVLLSGALLDLWLTPWLLRLIAV
jgi:stage II sporulation protein M